MNSVKPKKPFVAVILSLLCVGLGQVYVGRIKRGLLFMFMPITLLLILGWYFIKPTTKINLETLQIFVFLFSIGLGLISAVDSFFFVKSYNKTLNIQRKISLLIVIAFWFGNILASFLMASYIRINIVQPFNIPTGAMVPTLQTGSNERLKFFDNCRACS